MKLDRTKKHEGLGLTMGFAIDLSGLTIWQGNDEQGGSITVDESIVQAWLDAGHIKPCVGTKIVRVEGCVIVSRLDWYQVISCAGTTEELPSGATSKPVTLEFEVEA